MEVTSVLAQADIISDQYNTEARPREHTVM
jgi:hypothetical protein